MPTNGDDREAGLSRRGFVGAIFATAGVLVLTVAGETVAPLMRLAVLAPRNPVIGPQHLPVNQSAARRGSPPRPSTPPTGSWCGATAPGRRRSPWPTCRPCPSGRPGLPITCVEGWSAAAMWRGIPLPQLLGLVGAPPGAAVRVESLESASTASTPARWSTAAHAADPDTLLALECNGAPLDLDHGYPVRLIAPDRPGVLQTKWITTVVVL